MGRHFRRSPPHIALSKTPPPPQPPPTATGSNRSSGGGGGSISSMAQQQQQQPAGAGTSRGSSSGRMGRRQSHRCCRRAGGVVFAAVFFALQLLAIVENIEALPADNGEAAAKATEEKLDDSVWADAIWSKYKEKHAAEISREVVDVENGLLALPRHLSYFSFFGSGMTQKCLEAVLILSRIGKEHEAKLLWQDTIKHSQGLDGEPTKLIEWDEVGSDIKDAAEQLTDKPEDFLSKAEELASMAGGTFGYSKLWRLLSKLREDGPDLRSIVNKNFFKVLKNHRRSTARLTQWVNTMIEIRETLGRDEDSLSLWKAWTDRLVEGFKLIVSPERAIAEEDIDGVEHDENTESRNRVIEKLHYIITNASPYVAFSLGEKIKEAKNDDGKIEMSTIQRWDDRLSWKSGFGDLSNVGSDPNRSEGCQRAVLTTWALRLSDPSMDGERPKRRVEEMEELIVRGSNDHFSTALTVLRKRAQMRLRRNLNPIDCQIGKTLDTWASHKMSELQIEFLLYVGSEYGCDTEELDEGLEDVCVAFDRRNEGGLPPLRHTFQQSRDFPDSTPHSPIAGPKPIERNLAALGGERKRRETIKAFAIEIGSLDREHKSKNYAEVFAREIAHVEGEEAIREAVSKFAQDMNCSTSNGRRSAVIEACVREVADVEGIEERRRLIESFARDLAHLGEEENKRLLVETFAYKMSDLRDMENLRRPIEECICQLFCNRDQMNYQRALRRCADEIACIEGEQRARQPNFTGGTFRRRGEHSMANRGVSTSASSLAREARDAYSWDPWGQQQQQRQQTMSTLRLQNTQSSQVGNSQQLATQLHSLGSSGLRRETTFISPNANAKRCKSTEKAVAAIAIPSLVVVTCLVILSVYLKRHRRENISEKPL